MTASKLPVFLRILKDGKLLEVKQFTGDQIVIGREGNVDALIDDASVSPIHAMVEDRGGTYFICDLGSQSGTFFGGEKIIDHALESGAEFLVGQVTVEFHIGVPRSKKTAEGPAPTPAPVKPVAPTPPPAVKTIPKEIPKEVPKKPTAPPPAQVHAKPKAPPAKEPARETSSMGGGMAMGAMVASKNAPYSKHATFAPPGKAKLNEILRPGKGNVVEVIVTWGDRVLATRHFDKPQVVQIGSNPDNQIILPIFGSVRASHPLVKIEGGSATVFISTDMTGEVVKDNHATSFEELRKKGTMVPSGVGSAYTLQQNEFVKINLGEGVGIVVRFVGNAPDVLFMPFADLSINQLTAIIFGLMATAVFMFYAYLYAPTLPDKPEDDQEPPRKAQFFYKRPPQPVEMAEEKQEAPKAAQQIKTKEAPAPAQGEEGASAEPKKTKNATSKIAQKKAVTKNTANANPGGAPKAPPQKDVSKSGLLGVFGTKGIQDQINKANAGAGNVAGLSQSATGSAADGQGEGVGGSALRDTGANGNGTATVGIAGVKTKGRGGGVSGYGTGTLGAKKNASLIAGDSEATFSPGIDKEAIRRVVQENLKQIKACYEKGLNRNPGLYGKIVIQWTIGAGGRVTAAKIKNTTLDSADVENCSVSRLRLWKFPEPPVGEEAEVSYPFVFQAQD